MDKALLLYMPVLHSGYLNFLKNHSDCVVFVIGEDFLKEIPRTEREIRALSPNEMISILNSLELFKEVSVLDKKNLSTFGEYKKIIMPDEDVSHEVAQKYLSDKEVIFEKIFLRWDKVISTTETKIDPNRIISTEVLDKELMIEAFRQSEKSSDWWRQVGSVLVKGGKIINTTFNKHLPTSHSPYINGDPRNNFDAGIRIDLVTAIHAEASGIASAAKNGTSLSGASIYVTTFPCPTCARLICESGIKKVYYSKGYSLLDAEEMFKNANVEIVFVKID